MNFLNLKYFMVAAQELNFTRAAKQLYISQQSLSNHITKLEEYFGVQLFDRTPPMTLTAAGQSLFKNAETILAVKKQAEVELEDIKDFRSGDLTIGVTSARGSVILPVLLPNFNKLFPQVRLHLMEGSSKEIEEALNKGFVDLTIGFEPENAEAIQSEELQEEFSVIVVPGTILNEFFSHQQQAELNSAGPLSLELFRDCPFVAINRSTWAGEILHNYCQEHNLNLRVVVETSHVHTLVSLCLAGMGVIVCPRIFLDQKLLEDSKCGAAVFPLDYPPSHKKITINYLRGKYQTKAAQEFILMAKELLYTDK